VLFGLRGVTEAPPPLSRFRDTNRHAIWSV